MAAPVESLNTEQNVFERIANPIIEASQAFLNNQTLVEFQQQQADVELTNLQAVQATQSIAAERQAIATQTRNQELSNLAFPPGGGGTPESDAALRELYSRNPGVAKQILDGIGAVDQSKREDASRDAAAIQALPFDQRRVAILERATRLEAQGRDATETLSLLGMDEETQTNNLRSIQAAALTTAQRQTAVSGGGAKLGAGIVTSIPGVDGGDPTFQFETPVVDPSTGLQTTQISAIGGAPVNRQTGETAEAFKIRAIETAGGTAEAVAINARDQEAINVGLRQADATAIVRRGLQLLEVVGTGRPEAIKLAASQLFGITGADTQELNANLGKAVLSQLRATFGAQFTENEGKRLETIEANFGNSTEGNIRLLSQQLRLMERDARRGIETAGRNEDQFSAGEIQKALDFRLDLEQEGGSAPAAGSVIRFDAQGNIIP